MAVDEISIKCSDGFNLAGTLFAPERTPESSVVIASAMGVPRKFYRPLASFLCDNRIALLTFDYRGVGDSDLKGARGSDVNLHDWGRFDIDAAIHEVSARSENTPLFLLGHSCGGQLFGLAPSSNKLSGVIFISAQIPNWRLWPVPYNLLMLAMWYILIPVLSFGRSTFPARTLGISSVDVPSGTTSQWAQWARQPGYLFNSRFNLDTGRYGHFSFPILSYIINDDIYAPERSVMALLERMPQTETEIRRINGLSSGLGRVGHFGFFREKMKYRLWPEMMKWILDVALYRK
jgi:predicted alpha/beta hydrolase